MKRREAEAAADLDQLPRSEALVIWRGGYPPTVGGMFWFIWKRFPGSYLFFSSTNR